MTHQCDTGSWLFRMVMHFGGKLILLHCLVSLLMKGAFMQSYSFNIRIVIKRSPALPRMEKTNRFFIFSLSLSLCPSSHFKHERLGSGSDSDWILVFVDCWPDKKGFQKKKFVFSSRRFLLQLQMVCGPFWLCISFKMDVQLLNFALPCCKASIECNLLYK